MAFPTFNPAVPPSPQTRIDKTYRIQVVKFGDGYEQRSADGLNPIQRTPWVQWNMLTGPEADAIEEFFDTLGGILPFYYEVPGVNTGVCLYTVDNTNTQAVQRTAIGPNTFSLRVIMRQVYDLDS